MKYSVSTGAFGIIFDNAGKILLAHKRDFDLWTLPGGGIEKRETPIIAVTREIKEETGLDANVERLIGIYTKPSENDIIFAFLCTVAGGKIKENEEIDLIEYFESSSLPNSTALNHIEIIDDARLGLSDVIFKLQLAHPRTTSSKTEEFLQD
jgi:ADP-ribose pyrophosphatase YjhB (NUDIX family)